jgi:hypothetical protein
MVIRQHDVIDYMDRLLPLIIALICAVSIVVSRLLTNRVCDARGAEMIAARTTDGFIPAWLSLVYALALLGLLVALVWSFIATAWWAPGIVVLLYLLSGLVKSRIPSINMLIQSEQSKRL